MSNFDKHVMAFFPTHICFGPIQRLQSIRKIINFWYTFGWKWWVISFRDFLWLSDACSYDVDDVIRRVDRFGFQNFCSPVVEWMILSQINYFISFKPVIKPNCQYLQHQPDWLFVSVIESDLKTDMSQKICFEGWPVQLQSSWLQLIFINSYCK